MTVKIISFILVDLWSGISTALVRNSQSNVEIDLLSDHDTVTHSLLRHTLCHSLAGCRGTATVICRAEGACVVTARPATHCQQAPAAAL